MTAHPTRLLACALAALALGVAPPLNAQRSPLSQRADVIVLDRADAPVTNLTAADFVVREDGVAREVISVAPGPPPSPIVLLADTSQAVERAIPDLRKGLASFVDGIGTLDPAVQIGLRTFGERPTKVTDPTTAAMVQLGIERLFHRDGTGAYLLQAIVETSGDLAKAGATGAAIVVFVVESGPEFSQDDRMRVATALKRAGASLWVVVLQSRSGGLGSPEDRERAAVIGDGTIESGGLNLPVLSAQAIPQAFAKVQTYFASRLRITYGRPDTLVPPERLEIAARREDLRVLTPRWTAPK